MATILYSKSGGLRNAAIGKLETPIKMVIEHESDLQTKKGGVRDWLFNVEKSNKFGETIVGQNEFDVFQAAAEGAAGAEDNMQETYNKFIEHIQFMKIFNITAEMMEDANYGVAAETRRRAENFVRAYYKTQHNICAAALANAASTSTSYANATLDLTAGDGKALFSNAHKWGTSSSNTQTNYFSAVGAITAGQEAAYMEEVMSELAVKIRNMKSENGEALGYTADTIILPGNDPLIERAVKKAAGSDGALGNGYNDINIQYGNWNIFVVPTWQVDSGEHEIMVMSSEANKNLGGNMFFNRVPLSIHNWEEDTTGNYCWRGRCRFGVGFGTYKHIVRCHLGVDSAVSGTTAL